jgi:hypothetical protein
LRAVSVALRLQRKLALVSAVALIGALFVAAPLPASADTWAPGPDAQGANTFAGFIDLPTSGSVVFSSGTITVKGWVVDQTAQGWAGVDRIEVRDGGPTGPLLGQAQIAQPREDVLKAFNNPYWTNSGFTATINAASLSTGAHTIGVYAHTAGRGTWFANVIVNVAPNVRASNFPNDPVVYIDGPSEGERVDTDRKEYTMDGWAYDRNASTAQGSGIDRVQVYLDGERGASNAKLVGTATLNQAAPKAQAIDQRWAQSGWRLVFNPTQYASEEHNVYVYARSSVTGAETMYKSYFTIFDDSNDEIN